MQRKKGISEPHMLVKIIEDSKIPLGEEEAQLHTIKGKWNETGPCPERMGPSSLD